MYKTTTEVQETRKGLITVEMSSEKDNIEIYVRESVNCKMLDQAEINISPEGFIDLVTPILTAAGYTLTEIPEGM